MSARERLTLSRMFETLRELGYEGGYDAVRRYARGWARARSALRRAYFAAAASFPLQLKMRNIVLHETAEFGIVAPVGRLGLERLLEIIADPGDRRLPAGGRTSLHMLVTQLAVVKAQILENGRRIIADARSTELGRSS